MDAWQRSWHQVADTATEAVVVDARDDAADAFDRRLDFAPPQSDPCRRNLSMKQVAALFS